jgi:hypothetical protein
VLRSGEVALATCRTPREKGVQRAARTQPSEHQRRTDPSQSTDRTGRRKPHQRDAENNAQQAVQVANVQVAHGRVHMVGECRFHARIRPAWLTCSRSTPSAIADRRDRQWPLGRATARRLSRGEVHLALWRGRRKPASRRRSSPSAPWSSRFKSGKVLPYMFVEPPQRLGSINRMCTCSAGTGFAVWSLRSVN